MPTLKKSYCFTLNNYGEDEYENIKRNLESESRYAIIGREVGEQGTPHLQGYCIFKRAVRFNTIKSRYLPRCHIEIAAGSALANRTYCSKEGNCWEFGDIKQCSGGGSDGSRDQLAREFRSRLANGRSGLLEFADEFPGTYYYSGHNMLRNHFAVQPAIERPDVRVRWIYGSPGVGKSRKAHEELKEAFIKEPRTKWWSGYMLEKEVIIDDFGPNGIDINHLLRWFDRYKCYVETKGGMMPLYADNIIVTSNYGPRECFRVCKNNVEEEHPQIDALLRRIQLEFIQ